MRRREVEDWFYQPSWRRFTDPDLLLPLSFPEGGACWLIFLDEAGFGPVLAEQLTAAGQTVVTVRAGQAFAATGPDRFEIDPRSRADYVTLLKAMREGGRKLGFIVHLWGLDPGRGGPPSGARRPGPMARLLQPPVSRPGNHPGGGQAAGAIGGGHQPHAGSGGRRADLSREGDGPRTVPSHSRGADERHLPQLRRRAACARVPARRRSSPAGSSPSSSPCNSTRWSPTAAPIGGSSPRSRRPCRRRMAAARCAITGSTSSPAVSAESVSSSPAHLAESWKARLVLTGRSPVPPAEEWETWLAAHGEQDATSQRIVQIRGAGVAGGGGAVLRRRRGPPRGHGGGRRPGPRSASAPIQGLIHSAGVAGGGIIQLKDPEAAARVMAPKVQGTARPGGGAEGRAARLPRSCARPRRPCSAASGRSTTARPTPSSTPTPTPREEPRVRSRSSVNWDTWTEVGMAVNTPVSGVAPGGPRLQPEARDHPHGGRGRARPHPGGRAAAAGRVHHGPPPRALAGPEAEGGRQGGHRRPPPPLPRPSRPPRRPATGWPPTSSAPSPRPGSGSSAARRSA